jgi:predicted enzyme related to lactoylglutathione lyase
MHEGDVRGGEWMWRGTTFSRARADSARRPEEETTMDNLIVWADIPVTDIDRAIEFYSAVLKRPLMKMPGMDSVAIPAPDQPPGEGNGGATPQGPMPVAFDLVQTDTLKPSFDGCTIYLNADDDPEGMLQRAAAAGGEILSPLQDMGEMVGWIGFFRDSEGNRIGVHKSHS